MTKAVTILFAIGLLAILSCSNVSGKRSGKKDFCQLSPGRGRCRMSIQKWFYDSSSGECRNFTWGGCGGNANKFETKSICELVCKPGCRHERCSNTCPNGFIIDADGCSTCRCQLGFEQESCPSVECDAICPHGYQRDSAGCQTCDCLAGPAQTRVLRTSPQHQCPPVCYMFCQYGNRQDEYGCDVCLCKTKEEACGSQQCMMECPTGFATDSRGCETCECKTASDADKNLEAPDCSKRPLCTLYCRNGYVKGRDGCEICRCSRRIAERRIERHPVRHERRFGKTTTAEDVCGVRPMCTMFCSQGFQKDRKGCDICLCRPDPPVHVAQLPAGNSPAQLPTNIPSQLPTQITANIPSQQPADVPSQLPADTPAQLPANTGCSPKVCSRRTQCSFGFAKDEDGCDTCVCSNNRSRRRGSSRRDQ